MNSAHIGVGVHVGVVTLTGFVSSYGETFAAERAALRVKGVKAIAQEIEVRLPSDSKLADEESAARVVEILKWRVGLPAIRISVLVEKGSVTLSGDVEWQYQKAAAEAAIQNLSGGVGIANMIRVASAVEAAAIKDKIERALQRSAELDASRITVAADGGKVLLGGKVHAWVRARSHRAGR